MIDKQEDPESAFENGKKSWDDQSHQYVPTDEYIPKEEQISKKADLNYGEEKHLQQYSRVKSRLWLTDDEVRNLIDGIE